MKIALDYDGTVTEDTEGWHDFILTFRERGHDIRIVTFRGQEDLTYDLEDFAKWADVLIVFTEHQTKHAFCKNIGWDPDVWIDDCPALIDHDDKPWSEEKLVEWRKSVKEAQQGE